MMMLSVRSPLPFFMFNHLYLIKLNKQGCKQEKAENSKENQATTILGLNAQKECLFILHDGLDVQYTYLYDKMHEIEQKNQTIRKTCRSSKK
jgi:hypothetical protein